MNADQDAFTRAVTEALRAHGAIETDFGFFFAHHYAAYSGRNPRTGAIIPIPERWAPDYVPGEMFLADALGPGPRWSEAEHRAELVYDDTNEPIPLPPASAKISLARTFYDAVVASLRADREAKVPGCGTFVVRDSRDGRRVLTFKASAVLKGAMSDRKSEP